MNPSDKKADFSGVSARVDSSEQLKPTADFSGVSARVDSSEELVGERYTIEQGDTLSKIAKRHYGDANAWRRIFDANRDVIDDADRIFPGQVITLPPQAH